MRSTPITLVVALLTTASMTMAVSRAEQSGGKAAWDISQLDPVVRSQLNQKLGAVESHSTEHFAILHPGHDVWAKYTAVLLERAYDEFFRTFNQAGFELQPVGEPLVWVCFPDRDLFNDYARQADRTDMSWSQGYYSARTNVVAVIQTGFYDDLEAPASDAHGEVASTVHPMSGDESPRANRLESARATHELAHQLAFNTGLQKRGVMYPLWASEGLATNFEADAFGRITFGEANQYRRRALMEAYRRNKLMSLEKFVTLSRILPGSSMDISDIYAQCWGVFSFLMAEYPVELAAYMSHLASLDRGYRDQWTMRREFVAAFGPMRVIERRWQEHLHQLARAD